LVDGSTRLSAVANQAGVSFEQMLGILTAGYSTLGDMEKVASGAITIFTRLQSIQLEGEEGVETVAKLQKEFNGATKGVVNIVDQTTGQLRNAYDILNDLDSIWGTLDKNTQEALAFDAAGTRQKSVFLSILDNWDMVKTSVQSATDSVGSADKENKKYLDSISGRLEAFSSSFQQLSQEIVNSDLLKSVVNLGTGLLSSLTKIIDKFGLLNTTLVASLIPLSKFSNSGITQTLLSISNAINPLKSSIAATTTATIASATATESATVATTMFSTALDLIPLVAVIGGIFAITKAIDKLVVTDEELAQAHENQISKANESISKYKETASALEELANEQDTVKGKLDELYTKRENQTITKAEKEYLTTLQAQNTELQKQIDYKETIANVEAKKTEGQAIGALKGKTTGVYQRTSDGGTQKVNNEKFTDVEKIQYYTTEINHLTSELSNYKKVINGVKLPTDEIEKYTKQIAYYKQQLEENPQNSDIFQPKIDFIQSLIDGSLSYKDYAKATKEATAQQEQFITESDSLIKTVQPLSDALVSNTDESANLKTATNGAIENAKAAANSYDAYTKSLDKNTESATKNTQTSQDKDKSYAQWSKALTTARSNASDLSSILDEMNSKDFTGLSSNSVDKIISEYPELLSYIDNEAQLRDKVSEKIEKQRVIASNAISMMMGDDDNYYANLKKSEADRIISANETINTMIKNNKTLTDVLGSNYSIDLNNFSNLNQAKAELQTQLIKNSASAWSNFYSVEIDAATGFAKAITSNLPSFSDSTNGNFGAVADKYAQEGKAVNSAVSTYNKAINKLNSISKGTNITAGKSTKVGGSGKSKGSGSSKSSKDKFSETIDFTDDSVTNLKSSIEDLNTLLDNTTSTDKQVKIYNQLIAKETELQNLYKKRANSQKSLYEKSLNSLSKKDQSQYKSLIESTKTVSRKTFKSESTYNAVKNAQDLYHAWQESTKASKDATYQAKEYAKTIKEIKFNDKVSGYENKISATENNKDDIENAITLAGKGTKSQYNKEIKYNNDEVGYYNSLISATKSQMSGLKKYGKEWTELNDKVQEYQNSITDLKNSNSELNQSINQLSWDKFDDAVEKINDVQDELDNLADSTTDNVTKIALYETGMASTSQEIDKLKKEIESLNKAYKNKSVSEENYKDRLESLNDQLSNAQDQYKSYRESIIDTMETVRDDEIKVLNDKADAFKKVTDAQRKALESEQELHDYENSISEKTGNINDIQSRMTELKVAVDSGDRKAIAEYKDLQKQLSDSQKELKESEYDREMDLKKEALDKADEDYQSSIDKQIDLVENKYAKEEDLIKSAANLTLNKYTDVYNQLLLIAKNNNLDISSDLQKRLQDALSGINGASSSTSSATTGTTSSSAIGSSNFKSPHGNDLTKQFARNIMQNGHGSADSSSELNKYITKTLKYKPINYDEMVDLAQLLSVGGINSASDVKGNEKNKNKILTKLKTLGKFTNGGIVDAEVDPLIRKMTGEDTPILVKNGEGILKPTETQNYLEFTKDTIPRALNILEPLVSSRMNPSNLIQKTNNTPVTLQVENLLKIDSVSKDYDVVQGVKDNSTEIVNIIADKFKKAWK
jgi:chromosome segregation ATPase